MGHFNTQKPYRLNFKHSAACSASMRNANKIGQIWLSY